MWAKQKALALTTSLKYKFGFRLKFQYKQKYTLKSINIIGPNNILLPALPGVRIFNAWHSFVCFFIFRAKENIVLISFIPNDRYASQIQTISMHHKYKRFLCWFIIDCIISMNKAIKFNCNSFFIQEERSEFLHPK